MKKILPFFAVLLLTQAPALAAVEPSYDPGKPLAVTPWYGMAGPAQIAADQNFVTGMRPHHAGALTMSESYLADPGASNARLKQLARGIIHNQRFEIAMLDTVQHHLHASTDDMTRQRIATGNLSQAKRFYRAPMPGPLDAWAGPRDVSRRDVEFAKAMIIHHQGALDMARDYLNNPDAKNNYLELMCLDILLDQAQEIALMQSIIDAYPGNPDDIKIDPSMIHGMDGMNHGGGHDSAHH